MNGHDRSRNSREGERGPKDTLRSLSSSTATRSSCPFAGLASLIGKRTQKCEENDHRAKLIASIATSDAWELQISSTSPSSIPTTAILSPFEAYCLNHLDRWYSKSQSLKCPFLRRRFGDMLDTVETLMKHLVIRQQCWQLMGPPQSQRPAGHNVKQRKKKLKRMPLMEVQRCIEQDWKPESGKGYYVTGKLTTAIYRDDCYFVGPDPDMPIKGLRKYVGVASHLFDYHESMCTLKSLKIVTDKDYQIEAQWQLKGILKLPWHPHLPTFTGRTVYYLDDEGLIERHEEFWDMTVVHAFCQTLFPNLAARIWSKDKDNEEDEKGSNNCKNKKNVKDNREVIDI